MRTKQFARSLLVAAAAVFCAGAQAQPKSDWEIKLEERDWQEGEVKLPDYPKPENLIEFEYLLAGSFRFYVDSLSLFAGSDGAVRYTLVARSASGVENVSFNGLRCKVATHKVYATGRADKTWAETRNDDWKEIQRKSSARQHALLMRDFFCPAGLPITSREEGIDALRKGFHPQAVSNQPGEGRR